MLRAVRASFLVLLAACTATPPRLTSPPPGSTSSPASIIYVIRRSWHVDIGFAGAQLQPPLASLRSDFPAAEYLLFGFGDRHYLLDQDRGVGGLLVALWPGPGLMLATGLSNSPQVAFGAANVIEIAVTPAQARAAQQFVWRSLSVVDAAATPLHAGPYEGSLYYSASEDYSAWHTCNTWAAQALQAAGLPVRSFGVEFSGQVWRQVRRIESRQAADRTLIHQPPGRAPEP